MALIGNYSVLTKSCGRWFGGSTVSDNRSNFGTAGSQRGRFCGWGASRWLAVAAVPFGYLPPYSWILPVTGGGISSYLGVVGVATISYGNLAGGLNADTSLTPITGTGSISTAVILGLGVITAAPAGVGTLTADMTGQAFIISAPAGTGSVSTADIVGVGVIDSALAGTSSITAGGSLVIGIEASLSGSGVISLADMSVLVPIDAALAGVGVIDSAVILGLGVITAAPAGVGIISAAALGAEASVAAGLSGTGTLTVSVAPSLGNMAAEIIVTYTATATTTDIADAVWASLLEAGFDAARIMRVIAAATAGKSSGGPTSPVFRDLSDTENMLEGTADSGGNRSAVTYGGG